MSAVHTEPLAESTLPVVNGRVYHLDILPEELARNIIIVGDPDRVPLLAKVLLATVEVDRAHRGLRTITGVAHGEHKTRVSIVTSGMGQPSFEIVMGELVALREIDLKTRTRLPGTRKPLNIIRLGTSGAIQADTVLGTSIITRYSVGLDNSGVYYDIPAQDKTVLDLEEAVKAALVKGARPNSRFTHALLPYASKCDPHVVQALSDAAAAIGHRAKVGVTASASGFFCNQGRWLVKEAPPTVPDIDDVISKVTVQTPSGDNLRIENLEMETSFLCHLGAAMGYRCGAICVTVAQRKLCKFFEGSPAALVEQAGRAAVAALEKLDQMD
eukprot:m51a1_g12765 purine-nucleoside phosphorylase, putative (328) ;mRNA; r:1588-2711